MCNTACIEFGKNYLLQDEVKGKKVIEVGSYDVNGSLRSVVEPLEPWSYVGVDIEDGPGVDEICDVLELVNRFGKESFDLVISTELLEHAHDWRGAVSNLKQIIKPNGVLLITTRSQGFPYHEYPSDFWRYEVDDAKVIFSDLSREVIESDPSAPGIFVKVRKLESFVENDLSSHKLFSMIKSKRCRDLSAFELLIFKWKKSHNRNV